MGSRDLFVVHSSVEPCSRARSQSHRVTAERPAYIFNLRALHILLLRASPPRMEYLSHTPRVDSICAYPHLFAHELTHGSSSPDANPAPRALIYPWHGTLGTPTSAQTPPSAALATLGGCTCNDTHLCNSRSHAPIRLLSCFRRLGSNRRGRRASLPGRGAERAPEPVLAAPPWPTSDKDRPDIWSLCLPAPARPSPA